MEKANHVASVLRGCPNLEDIELACKAHVTDETLFLIAAACPKLKRLFVNFVEADISGEGLEELLESCTKLKVLDISSSTFENVKSLQVISERSALEGLCMVHFYNLTSVTLHLPHLASLELPECSSSTLAFQLPALRSLSVSTYDLAWSESTHFLDLLRQCPHLTALSIWDVSADPEEVTLEAQELSMATVTAGVAMLPSLESLTLHGQSEDCFLHSLVVRHPNLRRVTVSSPAMYDVTVDCPLVTSLSLALHRAARVTLSCPSLPDLDRAAIAAMYAFLDGPGYRRHVSDDGRSMAIIVTEPRCRIDIDDSNLRVLELAAVRLGVPSLESVSLRCPLLEALIDHSSILTPAALHTLLSSHPHLRHLALRSCDLYPLSAYHTLALYCPSLVSLSLSLSATCSADDQRVAANVVHTIVSFSMPSLRRLNLVGFEPTWSFLPPCLKYHPSPPPFLPPQGGPDSDSDVGLPPAAAVGTAEPAPLEVHVIGVPPGNVTDSMWSSFAVST